MSSEKHYLNKNLLDLLMDALKNEVVKYSPETLISNYIAINSIHSSRNTERR